MPGRGGGVFGRIADWFIPGNAYNSTRGQWNPSTTKVGIAGLIADQAGIPGGSNIVGMLANGGAFGSGISSGLQRENTYNAISDQFRDTRNELNDYVQSQDYMTVGDAPQVGMLAPQPNYGAPEAPQYDSGAQGVNTGYATIPSYGGGLASMAAVNVRPIGGALSFGNGHFNNGVGAGTGYGATNYANDAWGQTALGFGIGSSAGGSSGGYALSDAQKAQRMNADGRGFAGRGG